MFDTIAKNYGVSGPQAPATVDAKTMKATGATPTTLQGQTGAGGWFDASKWNPNNFMQGVQPLSGLNYTPPSKVEQMVLDSQGYHSSNKATEVPGYVTSSNGTQLLVTKNADGTLTFKDTYDDPGGKSNRDKMDVTYTYDPKTGTATPTTANSRYQAGDWVSQGQPFAQWAGSLAAMYGAAAALPAAGGGAGATAGGAAGAGGGLSSSDLAALYGSEGYGAGASGGGLVTAGNAGGALIGTGAADSAAANVGAQIAAQDAAGTAAGAGGGLSSADTAALYGNAGYTGSATGTAADAGFAGMGATTAGGASANPSFWGSLGAGNYGDAASAAGNWATSPSGLQTLGGLGSSYLQNRAAGNALDAQTNATNQANALQKYFYDSNRSDNAPLLATRNNALGHLNGLMSDPNSITSDPGYQFGLNQGVQGVDHSAASRGGLYSGATLKALQRYGTDYGTSKLNDAYSRYSTTAGLGAVGTNSNTQAGTNYANQAGANTTGLGNAAAGNALYNGSVWGNALNGAVSAYKNYNTPG